MNRRRMLKGAAAAAVATTLPMAATVAPPAKPKIEAVALSLLSRFDIRVVGDLPRSPSIPSIATARAYELVKGRGWFGGAFTYLDGLNAVADAYTFIDEQGRVAGDARNVLLDHGRLRSQP